MAKIKFFLDFFLADCLIFLKTYVSLPFLIAKIGCFSGILTKRNTLQIAVTSVGKIYSGLLGSAKFYLVCLDVGKILTVSIIKKILEYSRSNSDYINIIDAPLGMSYPVVATIHSVDYK